MPYIKRDFTYGKGDSRIARSGCLSLKISIRLLAVDSFSPLPHADSGSTNTLSTGYLELNPGE